MAKLTIFLLALVAICLYCEAKVFKTNCDLVHELRQQGFPENKMRDWVCLIQNSSSRRTDMATDANADGFASYGLFLINSRYWCSNSDVPGKMCNVTCADLQTDDITKAATCAKMIYERQSFSAWHQWLENCQGSSLPDISNCPKPIFFFINVNC